MEISPDAIHVWQWGPVEINGTILFTWIVMLLLVVVSFLVTRRLSTGTRLSRGQNMLEVIVSYMSNQIQEISQHDPAAFLPFVGTLFLFISVSNALSVVPLFESPTGSLTTTAALASCVFIAVPFFGIQEKGLREYLKSYIQPTFVMLPFNIIGELSRTLALSIRLFGNVMSGTLIVGVLISLAPLFFPIVMQAFGLLVGIIQAYIFAILAMVYIASGMRSHHQEQEVAESSEKQVQNEKR